MAPLTEKPIIAMKCITQMPVPPRASAEPASRRTRAAPSVLRARAANSNPSREPTTDMAYPSKGVINPWEKWLM
ncbi:hypothetical protein GCM10010106_08330 [Thermopolyspora flexuosa]|nr:hypothetical protein GCM10010106_08330 [Thermopolyspora flexuosa]